MQYTCQLCEHEFHLPEGEAGQSVKCPICGHRMEDAQPTVVDENPGPAATMLEPGMQMAGFRVKEKIGVGAMGYVYKAEQVSLDRLIALKVLPPAFADRQAFVQRFHEESAALSALNHPNIVTIIERGNVGKTYFFAMEYIDGPSLTRMMYRSVSYDQIINVALGTAAALEYAHDQGIVHRDIKPSNIMINSQNVVKVADFGLAGIMTRRHPGETTHDSAMGRMGTPSYMSPEQKENPLAVDGRTDIFSLGVVLFELLAGRKPELPLGKLPSELAPSADPRLDAIVSRCLCIDPDERYQTASELVVDLKNFEEEYRRAPACPECGEVSPVREQQCVECGHDLREFFDSCPECGRLNRHEVRHCLYCKADMERSRTMISRKVTLMLDHADRLRIDHDFEEAMQILDEVQDISGKAFAEQRERAALLRDRTDAERRAAARRAYAEARRMLRQHRYGEAIEQLKQIPEDIKDTSEAIEKARRDQADYVARRKSVAVMNLIIFALGLILLLVVALLAFW
jgi:predicted Ser/Thr protein kinase/predicted amidophosphoribosyltransferase